MGVVLVSALRGEFLIIQHAIACDFFLCLFRFEAENSFLRAQNIYSNRQAPSRDICNSFAVLNDLRHISSGGYIASGSRHRYSLILVTHTVTILKGVVMD